MDFPVPSPYHFVQGGFPSSGYSGAILRSDFLLEKRKCFPTSIGKKGTAAEKETQVSPSAAVHRRTLWVFPSFLLVGSWFRS